MYVREHVILATGSERRFHGPFDIADIAQAAQNLSHAQVNLNPQVDLREFLPAYS